MGATGEGRSDATLTHDSTSSGKAGIDELEPPSYAFTA